MLSCNTAASHTRGGKKGSAGLRLNQLCPPYVAPSSISFFGRRLSGVHTVGNRFVKNRITNRFCQSSAGTCVLIRAKRSFGAHVCFFSNRPFEGKHVQTIRHCSVDVAHGLALLFGIGTRALPPWDSKMRWNNLYRG